MLDFDGLLADTEVLHYRAYQNMCRQRGYNLDISFREYCQIAHRSAEGLEKMVYGFFPQLKEAEPDWSVLYAEKKAAIVELLKRGEAQLMPGAEEFLQKLKESGVASCVVTNSAKELISTIKKQYPILDSIPVWITREYYSNPKPHPECYQYAIDHYAKPGEPVIGIEDTIRGVKALQGTRAQPVLVCPSDHPCLDGKLDASVWHFESLIRLCDDDIELRRAAGKNAGTFGA